MKKLLAVGLFALTAFGVAPSFGHPPCSAPVSVDCEYTDENGRTKDCHLYVETDATGVMCESI